MKEAVIFYARDFLANEFALISSCFENMERIYLVTSANEYRVVQAIDNKGVIYNIDAYRSEDSSSLDYDISINKDRYLRNYPIEYLERVTRILNSLVSDICEKYFPRYYFDEPVSGYPNDLFNKAFSNAGALCFHFQTSWLPGYLFFVSDSAQRFPVRLDLVKSGELLVDEHIERRKVGLARPSYVLNYGKLSTRIKDMFVLTVAICFRVLFRRRSYYLNRDISSHVFQLRSLYFSLFKRYDDISVVNGKHTYVIFPVHYEPESILNYFSEYQRQEEIASQILDSLPSGFELVLKEHPSQPGALHQKAWQKLSRSNRVKLISGGFNVMELLRSRNDIIVSIGSTMALEAALNGLRVGVLGDVHFKEIPGIVRLETISDWVRLIEAPPVNPKNVKSWYSEFVNSYCFEGSIMKNKTDLSRLSQILKVVNKHNE